MFCRIKNNPNRKLILITIYISHNVSMRDIKLFLDGALLPLIIESSRALEEITGKPVDYCDRFVIFEGDFNVNFSLP